MATALNRAVTILAGLCSAALFAGGGAAAAECRAAGGWDLEVAWPQRTVAVELTVGEGEDGPTVRWRGPQGELESRDVACDGPSLSFSLEVRDREDEPVRLRYEGRVDGRTIEGRLTTPRGLEIEVTGERRDEEAAAGP